MKESYIVRSINRSSTSTSSTYFSVMLPLPILDPKSVRLKYVSIPNTIYNINTTNNNLSFNDPVNGTVSVNLSPGSYDISNLTSVLGQLMTSNGSQQYSVVYKPETFRVTFSATSPFSLQLNIQHTVASVIGFPATMSATGTSLTGTSAAKLNQLSVFINIDQFYPNGVYSDKFPFSFIVPINKNAGDVCVFYENTNFKQCINISKQPIYSLTVTLYDQNKNVIDLNGSEWEFLLEFE